MTRHSVREVRRQVRESGPAGVVAVLLVTVSTAWGGMLWTVRDWVVGQLLARDRAATVVAVLRTEGEAAPLTHALISAFPGIRADALNPRQVQTELAGWFPELSNVLLGLDATTFPALVQVVADPQHDEKVAEWLRLRPEVTLVESSRTWQARLEQTTSRVLALGFGLAFALLLACCAVVLLVVRLLVIEHSDEIAIMRLIGAHETDIRLPYLVCGALLGTVGGLLGAGLLLTANFTLRSVLGSMTASAGLLASLPPSGAIAGSLGAVFGLASLPKEP